MHKLVVFLLIMLVPAALSLSNWQCSCCMFGVSLLQASLQPPTGTPWPSSTAVLQNAASKEAHSIYQLPNYNEWPCVASLDYYQLTSDIADLVATYSNHSALNVCSSVLGFCYPEFSPVSLTCAHCDSVQAYITTSYQADRVAHPTYTLQMSMMYSVINLCKIADPPIFGTAFGSNTLECMQWTAPYFPELWAAAIVGNSTCPPTVPCT